MNKRIAKKVRHMAWEVYTEDQCRASDVRYAKMRKLERRNIRRSIKKLKAFAAKWIPLKKDPRFAFGEILTDEIRDALAATSGIPRDILFSDQWSKHPTNIVDSKP